MVVNVSSYFMFHIPSFYISYAHLPCFHSMLLLVNFKCYTLSTTPFLTSHLHFDPAAKVPPTVPKRIDGFFYTLTLNISGLD